MDHKETATLLTYVASFDRRNLTEADVLAWNDVLHQYPFADAKEAVRRFYSTETGWIMPGDVHRLMRQVRNDRERDQQKQNAIEATPMKPTPSYTQLRQSIKEKYADDFNHGVTKGNADRAYETTLRQTGDTQKAHAAAQKIRDAA